MDFIDVWICSPNIHVIYAFIKQLIIHILNYMYNEFIKECINKAINVITKLDIKHVLNNMDNEFIKECIMNVINVITFYDHNIVYS